MKCEHHLYNLFITYLLMCVLRIYIFTLSTQEYVASSKHHRACFLLFLCAHVALNRCCFWIPEACMSAAVLLSQKMRLFPVHWMTLPTAKSSNPHQRLDFLDKLLYVCWCVSPVNNFGPCVYCYLSTWQSRDKTAKSFALCVECFAHRKSSCSGRNCLT